jgi:hypothetical protein
VEDGGQNFAKIIEVNHPVGVIYRINSEAIGLFNTNCVLHVNYILTHSRKTYFGEVPISHCHL